MGIDMFFLSCFISAKHITAKAMTEYFILVDLCY